MYKESKSKVIKTRPALEAFHTFYDFAIGIHLAGLDNIRARVQLKAVGFVLLTAHFSNIDVLQGNNALGFLVLNKDRQQNYDGPEE